MYYLLNNFFVFSIFGYFLETLMFNLLSMHNQSGFLHLIWTPFYGIGVLLSIFVFKYIEKLNVSKIKRIILSFVLLFVILTLVEYFGGKLLEIMYGYSLWTYEHIPLHFNKYTSVPTSIGWVCFSFLYYYVIKKYSDKLINRIPHFLTISLFIIFIVDNIVTILGILKFRNII